MRLLLFLLITFNLFSCDSNQPKQLLSQDKMAEIIADISIYEQGENRDISQEERTDFVLKKHKITKEIFKANYTYYFSKTSAIDEILTQSEKIILNKDPAFKEKTLKDKKEREKKREEEEKKEK